MVQIYCFKCKKQTKTIDTKIVRAKNGRYILKGKCAICKTKKAEFVPEHIKAMQGEGVLDFVKRVVRAFKGPRKDKMPPPARALLEQVKDEKITHLEIYRTPLSPILKGVINLVKSRPFDELYHLFMVIETESGKQLLIEKNEVINFRNLKNTDLTQNSQGQEVAVNKEITIGELLDNSIKAMGEKFYLYNAINNNCQIFIYNLLKNSGLGNQDNYNFILQDVKDLVPSFWENVADKITDLAGAIDIIKQGEGRQSEIHAIEFKKKGYSLDKAKRWMIKHEKPIGVIHEKENTYWFNQTPKNRYSGFIKKKVKPNINLVIGFLK